jgi:hypothetical protein
VGASGSSRRRLRPPQRATTPIRPPTRRGEDGQLTGFLIAVLLPAPPVYDPDPGGLTCQIDDFTVSHEEKWATTGAALLRAGLAEAAQRGAVQAVVVTAHLDHAKRQALRSCGLEVALEWRVTTDLQRR